MTTQQLDALADVTREVVQWRRHLHRNPELSFQEHETARFVEARLREIEGLTVTRPTETSVLAVLRGGAGEGRTVLLRADMDALPIQEEGDFEFVSSVPGVMHACGHDGHTAVLLGAAKVLASRREQLRGELRFVFQHAEEVYPGGAQALVDAGVMDGVDVAVGQHLDSQSPAGKVAVKAGPVMAAPDTFEITVLGKGGHAAHPDETVDPLFVGAQIVTNLQAIVSRNVNPLEPLVVSVTQFHAGTADNVIADRAVLGGTVRSFDPELRKRAPELIERIVQGVTAAHGARYDLKYQFGYRSVHNDEAVTEVLRDVVRDSVGEAALTEKKPTMGGEDFSAYLTRAPGSFFFVGAGNVEAGITAPHHHPRFALDESSLEVALRVMVAAGERFTLPD